MKMLKNRRHGKHMWKAMAAVLLVTFLAVGCRTEGEKLKKGEQYIFYMNLTGTSLVRTSYAPKEHGTKKQAEEVLKALKAPKEGADYISAIPKNIKVQDVKVEEGKAEVNFNASYEELNKAAEVLLRAAVVQSLTQIEQVEYVAFLIDGKPLTDSQGQEIGYMQESDFVQNIGPALNSYQKADLKLYFANEKGDALKEQSISVRYNSNMSVEKLVIEQLIKGPSGKEEKATLPSDTKLLGVSVKDGICYVNFNEGFLAQGYDVSPEVVIYSLVNSITENGNAVQVQISVNGESAIKFRDMIDLSKPISRNLEFLEETKK